MSGHTSSWQRSHCSHSPLFRLSGPASAPASFAGMQRTRAESSLQRSLELEGDVPAPLTAVSSSPLGTGTGAPPSTTTSVSASRYFNTPRGRLLQALAAEAAAAQKERSRRETREVLPASHSGVLGTVDPAGSSPSKIPRQPSVRGNADGAAMDAAEAASLRVVYRSPSKIPRPTLLGVPPGQDSDENVGSLPPSPDKVQSPAAGAVARFGRALSSSIENMHGFYGRV